MALFTLERMILLAVVLMPLAAAEEAEEAENPTIEICPVPSSVGAPQEVTKYFCSAEPEYTVGTPASTTMASIGHDSGKFDVTRLGLALTSTYDCGVQLTAPVTCNTLYITIGSKAGGMDGSEFGVGGVGVDGLTEWECTDETPSLPINMKYYFPISFTGAEETAAATVQKLYAAYLAPAGRYQSTTDQFEPMLFEMFSEVDKNTEIYLLKEADDQYHTFFLSAETTILFKADQYQIITGAAQNSALARKAGQDCANAVRLCFDDGCDDAATTNTTAKPSRAAIASSLGLLLALIPFLVVVFN